MWQLIPITSFSSPCPLVFTTLTLYDPTHNSIGAAVVWDSEVEAAALDNREVIEDFLNEWELEPPIPSSNDDDVQIIEDEKEDKVVDKTVECTKKENGESKIKKQSKSRYGKRRSSKKGSAFKSKQKTQSLIKTEADHSDKDNDVEEIISELENECERQEKGGEVAGGEGHAYEMVLEPSRDPNNEIKFHETEIECKIKSEMCDAMRSVEVEKIVEYGLKLEVGAVIEVKREMKEEDENELKSEEKIKKEEEEEEEEEEDVVIVGEEHMSLETLGGAFQEGNHSNGFSGGSRSMKLRNDDDENNEKNNIIVAEDDNDINGNNNSDNPSNNNEHSSYRSRMERKKSMNKIASEQALLVSNTLPHLLPSRSLPPPPPLPLPLPQSLPVLPILSTQHLSDLSIQFINYMLLHLAEHFLSLSEFEAFADRIDRKFLLYYIVIHCKSQ